ncbi:hypothetical protein EI77_00909 [Prosthecobacter fusiformis]|uniref:Tetratricopeptide repeat protein n=1 Tax=Prosthecobacter fusiformis TaxID=48464 RepID=A0A4R7SSD8_9BACT|nr:hypothetical protein [Prosthecobacter fusiformis]TDU81599.1 hypothetical protein EI77_00909 [Prosthecobacter fusiformis]
MNRTLIIRLGLIALFILLIRIGWEKVKGDDGLALVFFVAIGFILGLVVVFYALPWFGDLIGTIVYSSGEKVQVNEGLKAAAKLAQGDYEGAIAEHEKALAADPSQSFPIAEIAKICADRLKDPVRAMGILKQHLAAREWPEDDATFLRFRIVDLQLAHFHDFAAARSLLEGIIADFPNTRHSANARHKLNELEQAEYKSIVEQRAKAAGKP